MKICTQYWAKPIPLRQFDWSAWEDGGDEHQTGWGATEAEAIQDLKENLEAQGIVDAIFPESTPPLNEGMKP